MRALFMPTICPIKNTHDFFAFVLCPCRFSTLVLLRVEAGLTWWNYLMGEAMPSHLLASLQFYSVLLLILQIPISICNAAHLLFCRKNLIIPNYPLSHISLSNLSCSTIHRVSMTWNALNMMYAWGRNDDALCSERQVFQ
ncbi:hypothetical protein K402DRAFT_199847 [Aulographum hederae CBS 113979]|uniref:Uncharacterized protein n=1 Tax=Aulographum hederae CBS 113979 TaxID=1176131 RepID=A0A6G1HC12_9PEZI|nr:hypothetical protein K402DRAFT_199847 [Aulographum hederae CBS 113979]